MNMESSMRTKMVSLQVFTSDFCRRFKRDPNLIPHQAIPMSRNISIANNEWLTRETSNEEIRSTVNRISPLKDLGPNDMQTIFYQK